jgi:uncharacterized membrane protein YfcA
MSAEAHVILVLSGGAFLVGLIMGLAGFGAGLVALGIWLNVAQPLVAVSLVLTCSLISTLVTFRLVWHAVHYRSLFAMLIGGAIGLPIGILFLSHIDPAVFKFAVGILLIAHSAFRLWIMPGTVVPDTGRFADLIVGMAGGILSGFAGIPGPVSTAWCSLKGWGKDMQRAVYQSFNSSLVCLALVTFAFNGWLKEPVWSYTLFCLPGLVAGLLIGMATYKYLDDNQFKKFVLWSLLVVGISLVVFP